MINKNIDISVSTKSFINDIEHAVANISPEHKIALQDTILEYFDTCPVTVRVQLELADAHCVVWINLPDTLIRFLSPNYYDALDKEQFISSI